MHSAQQEFLSRFPDYAGTGDLDRLRATEYARLDRHGHVYLDYTGGGLYADCQVRQHLALLLDGVFGNPHSSNPTSALATELVERCRRRILTFFGASADEYAVVFTGNASQALKLVGESYPFSPQGKFLLTFDNHNSVNGLREFARAAGAQTVYVPVTPPDMRLDEAAFERHLAQARPGVAQLLAYPAQSNFSGVQHPLEWVARARARGWDVLLDAAAYVPTNRLDLGRVKPDFLVLSFYKMFGYPTGVGALIARHEALSRLKRPWFAGGTITVASVQADRHYLAAGPAAFEEGTLNYTTIPAVEIGLDWIEALGLDVIHRRVTALAGWLIDRLVSLRHGGGAPVVSLYGPATTVARGATITMNLHRADGTVIDHQVIEAAANTRQISLRTGCFCNPGAGEMALGLARDEIESCFLRGGSGMTYHDFRRCIDGKSSGALRISFGVASNFDDAAAFARFVEDFVE